MPVGFIGVGNIGRPMAHQLMRAGYSLIIHDLSRDAGASLLEAGAVWADSVREVAAQSEIVATCLPGPAEMEQVTLGENGILDALKPGSLYIDHTTNAPALVRQVHEACQRLDVAMIDAPVSGGKERAAFPGDGPQGWRHAVRDASPGVFAGRTSETEAASNWLNEADRSLELPRIHRQLWFCATGARCGPHSTRLTPYCRQMYL